MPRTVLRSAWETGERCLVSLRTSPALRAKIERACAASGRSMAAECEMRLEASFNVPEPPDDAALLRRVRTEVHVAAVEAFKSALPTLRDLARPSRPNPHHSSE